MQGLEREALGEYLLFLGESPHDALAKMAGEHIEVIR
jgi:hypothetical protein